MSAASVGIYINLHMLWNTLVFWTHGVLTGHKTYLRLTDPKIWGCEGCGEERA